MADTEYASPPVKDKAYYEADKKRQDAVDRRGYYTRDDAAYVRADPVGGKYLRDAERENRRKRRQSKKR